MTRKADSSVEDLFEHFHEIARKSSNGSPDAVKIAASVLTLAAVLQVSPAGSGNLLKSVLLDSIPKP
jgi:hypothetical protein